MTSSSSFAPLATPELRSGNLTRFGSAAVLGDAATEQALASLVEDARTAARSQGYAVGWAEGRREAAAEAERVARQRAIDDEAARGQWEARQRDAVEALSAAAEALVRATADAEAAVHAHAIGLARELTELMVGHELRGTPDSAADVAARVLAVAPADPHYVLRVHPETAGGAAVSELGVAGVQVVSDPTLGRHDAVVETEQQLLDLRFDAALARVREALT